MTIIAGGKSRSRLQTAKEINVPPAGAAASASPSNTTGANTEAFLRDVLAPSLYDLQKDVAELNEKYEKLIRLLAASQKKP